MPSNTATALGEVRGRGKDTAKLDHIRRRVDITKRERKELWTTWRHAM